MSYQTLQRLANRFASALQRLGLTPGMRVSVHLPNCPQFLIAYYGILKAGGIVVPFNPLYVEGEIARQLRDSGAEIAVTLDLFYPRIAAIRHNTNVRDIVITRINDYFPPHLRLIYPLKARREGHYITIPRAKDVHRLHVLLDEPSHPLAQRIDPQGPAVLLYTGGTTGIPKGAVLTHRNLVSNTLQTRSWFTKPRTGTESILAVLPFFHSYGMTSVMNYAVSLGSRMLLLPRFQVDDVLRTIDRYHPSLFPAVPTIYTALVNHPHVKDFDLRSITACISGAAPLPVELQTRFETLTGGRLVEGYGLTEASPVTHTTPIFGVRKRGSIGIPIPDTVARIVDADMGTHTLGAGEVGELVISGPQVMAGYWNKLEETAHAVRGGWLYTGDLATMDHDGYFFIIDRKKELIITGGMNVYPREVEEVLYAHPAVMEAAIIGVPDAYRGEIVKSFVVLKPGALATPENIIEHCRKHLAPFKVPKEVEFRNELPKSLVGKILRRVLVEEDRSKRL
jgi:long-chain acyl-CoA synthetase